MKKTFLIIPLVFSFLNIFARCDKESTVLNNMIIENNGNMDNNNEMMSSKIIIKIGTSTFNATLYDNTTATAFKAMLPMTINMRELNNNEKFFDFSTRLPTNSSNPSTIQAGDLMMYGANALVLFYKTFSTSYSYTRLGHIDDTTGLSAALGNENVSVSFELH